MCIYSITNNINGKVYIGLTRNAARKRWRHHVAASSISNKASRHLCRAFEKYGVENFTFAVIDTAETLEQLSHKERFWISHMNTVAPDGYNLTLGGYTGAKLSLETTKIRSEQGKIRAQMEGRTEAFLADIARWRAENPNYKEIYAERAKRTHTGRKRSTETRKNMSNAQKGLPRSEQRLLNQARAHMKGRVICCSNGEKYLSSYEAASATGADRDKIGNVCSGKRKSTRGFIFWYEDITL